MRSNALNKNSQEYGAVAEGYVLVPDAATYSVDADDSGKVHIVPDLTADCTITLPTEKLGLNYEFWYGGTAADAQDWIIKTSGNSNYFVGGCVGHDTDAGGDDTYVVDADGNSNSQLTVYTPIAGTWVKVVCNGLLWYINGSCVSATDAAHAFADQ
tara:strand:- start:44 stop:511 length:468 start_codon:yes stop_codon:yes gene_type:complete